MEPFHSSYFEEETRSGFPVPAMMKRVWAADQKVLEEVLRIAYAHGIQCFAAFGTLLGAVRHRGFVPWDDDMDIQVDRRDYVRFFQILKKELPEHYQVYSYYTDTPNKQPQGCVMNRRKPDYGSEEDRRITEDFFGCPYVIGIDIFPLDHVPDQGEERSFHKDVYGMVYDCAQRYEELRLSGELNKILTRIEELLGQKLREKEDPEAALWKLSDQIAMLYMEEDTASFTDMKSLAMRMEGPYFPAEWFSAAVPMSFEHVMIPVPIGYQGILEIIYGRDFMRRQKFTATHEYPFYQKQEEWRRAMREKKKGRDDLHDESLESEGAGENQL